MQTTCEKLEQQINGLHNAMYRRMSSGRRDSKDVTYLLMFMNDRLRLIARTSKDPRKAILELLEETNMLSLNLIGQRITE